MTGPELSVVFSASVDDDLFTGVTRRAEEVTGRMIIITAGRFYSKCLTVLLVLTVVAPNALFSSQRCS